jgi:hypothetical protein
MSIYFSSNPTDIVYNIPVNNTYTISYNVSGLSPNYINFWFIFSSLSTDVGFGVIVGPVGPTSGNPTTNWNGYANHAIITSNIAQTTFYYPDNITTDSSTGNTYNPLGTTRTCTIYGANANYSNVTALCCQILAGSSSKWGLVGEFNSWGGAGLDIVMSETFSGSAIFTANLPYNPNIPNAREFKIRINQNWSFNYGSSSNTWPTGNLISSGNNIIANILAPMQYYIITMNLNNKTFSSTLHTDISCFGENTKILTNKGYVVIQNLQKGDLIKTLKNDYVPIHSIGKKEIYHHALKERIKDQLYKCSQSEYPEVFETLIITGCHSILVSNFKNKKEEEKALEVYNGRCFITNEKQRLPCCTDERSVVYETPGNYTIYHFALENENYFDNYGVYANGLLVETCSKRYLNELSNMLLLE